MLTSKLPHVGTTIFTVMSQLAAQHDAVNLGQGFPDFEGPDALKEALIKHTYAGRNQYAPMTGIPALREQIARKCLALYGHEPDVDGEITVTSGATEALYAAITAVVKPGDEVVVLDPCYDSYEPAIALNGARAVHVPLRADDFGIDWEALSGALSPRTRMILINSPHNPSGAVLTGADLDRLAELIRSHDILLLSDEVYEHIIFDQRSHASVLAHAELRERAFVVSSFGKTYHITGWKIGYCVAPKALSAEFRKVHQYLTFCTFHAAQHALADMMASDSRHHLELPDFYQAKRDAFQRMLAPSRFRLLPVHGAYFQLVDYSPISDLDDQGFARWLTSTARVAAIPVSAFCARPDGRRLVRFCFAKREETLQLAAERLCQL